jgi:VIT1/CCC1 family predicted Fe2+/Mn2+ transporter
MSMAAGEYVSVSSQADTEQADLARERKELATDNEAEHDELAKIYIERGLDPNLARQVAEQLMAKDALGAHARDELGIFEAISARPVQAAVASAVSFSVGAAFPLLMVILVPVHLLIPAASVSSLIFLAILGSLAARIGGASLWKGAVRVTFWGALAMGITAAIGAMFGTVI